MKKFSKHKPKFAAITIVLLMASVLLTLHTPVKAQYTNMQEGGSIPLPAGVTPDVTLDTLAYLSFRPNPVGVGQTILVNIWLTPPLHVSRYFSDYKVTITDPDGNEDVVTLDSYHADTTAWFEYVVDQIGTWKLKFEFPGGYFPTGNYTIHAGAYFSQQADTVVSFPESVYYRPSSTPEVELVVQEEQVLSWPPSSLPTDYWTRPVSPENREWWPILGYYPATGVVGGGTGWPADTNIYANPGSGMTPGYGFTPYVQGPNSAHIAWKKQITISGLIGGSLGDISFFGPDFGAGPSIVYAGRCYEVYDKPGTGTSVESYWGCYDLRTGEVYWEYPAATTTIVWGPYTFTSTLAPNIVHFETGRAEVPGGDPVYGLTDYLVAISGGRLYKWDPWTGALSLNVTAMDGTLYADPYVLSVQNIGSYFAPEYRLINWTIDGSTTDFSARVMSNITWPWSNLGTSQDFEAGVAARVTSVTPAATGVPTETHIQAASLRTGNVLWNATADKWYYSGSCIVADHGKIAVLVMGGYFMAWDLQTGNLAWKSEAMDFPWAQSCFGTYGVHSAYGLLYRAAYDGVYAFDWDTGDIVWRFKSPSVPYETPYAGYNSFMGSANIADGKLYIANSEHTATQPVTRGWKLHCINATTGEGIWNITGSAGYGVPGAIADGYLTAVNSYDGYMYVYGKGQSATTVTASPKIIADGASVMIEGTVLDMSPAQPGTPCVSKESMGPWMEYLHMQRPIPADVTGVPVSLDTLDPNGNYIHIGDVTTDMSGTFGFMWTPEVPGEYKVMATFMGDDSYGSSFAETHMGVGEAPEPPPEPVTPATEPEVQENIDRAVDNLNNSLTPILYGTIVAVVVVAILVLYTLWTVRKLRK